MGEVTRRRRASAIGIAARASVAGLLAVRLLVAGPGPVLAADGVTFGDGSGSSKFGQFIEFKQPITVSGSVERVEVLVETPGAIGPTVIPLPEGAAAGSSTLDYRVDLTDGHVVPNTPFTVRFRVTTGTGTTVGPAIRHTYDDDRYKWKSLDGKVVRVHWVEGDEAFGQRALRIGDDAVAATSALLGVSESDPIDFFIYADQAAFYAALGPATRENVGGQAHPDIRTLFALITPDEINASWVESVVPHELTHVVFATAVDNPYHAPPHWLNEGLAVYLSDGYQASDRDQVEAAAKDGSIIPLDGLAGAFPTTRDRFFLAYAESVSAVDRIVRASGRDALIKLIRSYANGVSDDQAFQTALGKDVAGFEADWLHELGAKSPTKRGPQPAPVGPLPAGWGAPQPDPSFEVVGSLPPVPPSAPGPGRTGDAGLAPWLGPIGIIGLALVAVIATLVVRRARGTALTDPSAPGDNRLFGRPPLGDGSDDPSAGAPPASRLWSSSDWSLPSEPTAETAPEALPERSPWDRPLPEPAAASTAGADAGGSARPGPSTTEEPGSAASTPTHPDHPTEPSPPDQNPER